MYAVYARDVHPGSNVAAYNDNCVVEHNRALDPQKAHRVLTVSMHRYTLVRVHIDEPAWRLSRLFMCKYQ